MYYAGIDLGGTGIKAALVTREGEILHNWNACKRI